MSHGSWGSLGSPTTLEIGSDLKGQNLKSEMANLLQISTIGAIYQNNPNELIVYVNNALNTGIYIP